MYGGEQTTSFTAKLVEEIKSGMADTEFEEIRLADVALPYCRGCYNCFYSGEQFCPHKTLMQPIIEKMKAADCLILSSPVYALHISALVKNFFDLGAYNFHRPSFFTKKAIVVSSTAGGGAATACAYMKSTLKHWGYNRVYKLPVVRMGAVEPKNNLKAKCQKLGKKLYQDTASLKLHSPTYKRIFFYQVWRIMSQKTPGPDKTHWQESGLVNRVFAPGIRLGPFKFLFGKMMHGIMGAAMKNV
jgi:multimeric flavodoxin WrbA